ncbi:MAG TPA: hypothetical protein VFR81_18085, partial [Longimicrobium sp.]|nr:hypothetical protein [Longimicrobium sp.]
SRLKPLVVVGLVVFGAAMAIRALPSGASAAPNAYACSGVTDTLEYASTFLFRGGVADHIDPYEERKLYVVHAQHGDEGVGTFRAETRGPRPVLRILRPSGEEVPSQPDDYWGMTVARSFNVEPGCYVVEVSYADRGSHRYFLKSLRDRDRIPPERMVDVARREWERRPRPR